MSTLLYTFTLILLLFRNVSALLSQDTLYDYSNRTLYIHLHNHDSKDASVYGNSLNKLFKIPFDAAYQSGDYLNSTIASPPTDKCNIVIVQSSLYSLCPSSSSSSSNNNIQVFQYNSPLDVWNGINLNSTIQYYNDTTYLYTDSDDSGIYIFSGLFPLNSSSLSNRMIRLDTNSWTTSLAISQVQPSPFYKSSSLQINSNTQALFGGITSQNKMVSMMEIPVWQYNSWAERPAITTLSTETIEERTGSLMLPVFSQFNDFTSNQTLTNFEVSSVFMMGGKTSENNDAFPQFASLNVSTNIWQWQDLSNTVSLANNNNSELLSLDSIIAAGMIYDTLITIKNSSSKSNFSKRSTDLDYIIHLYNSTSLESVSSIDYKYSSSSSTVLIVSHSSKSLTIALSVIIPILVIIILACLLAWLYKRYKKKKEDERHEKEVKEIVDFYEHQHKQLSELTFSSYDSDYKSNGSDYNFENSDDQSLNSWRKKRHDFEQQKNLYNVIRPRIDSMINLNSGGSIRRSLSVASNFISQSLKRNNSTQSSIATFITAKTNINNDELEKEKMEDNTYDFNDSDINYYSNSTSENPFQNDLYTIHSDSDVLPSTLIRPPPAVPKHTDLLTFPNRTSSTLNHIPEDASISTFHSQNLGFIPMKQAYSPQQSYMKHLSQTFSIDSSSLTNSSSIYTKLSKRPLSMSSGSISSNNNFHNNKTISHINSQYSEDSLTQKISQNDHSDTGSISEDELNNMEVQVLVGSKRRTKLRVVNPDNIEEDEQQGQQRQQNKSKQDNEQDPFVDESIIEEKPRCSSSSSEQSNNENVRRRIASNEQYNQGHDESFM